MKTGLLYSGGIDSTALLFWKKPSIAYFIDYGQISALGELESAKYLCEQFSIPFSKISVNCSKLGSGLLSNRKSLKISPNNEWWPFRNQLLITLASMKALKDNIKLLYIGCVKTDKSYADGTKRFLNMINKVINIQEGALKIEAPGINLNSIELIRKSKINIKMLFWCHSCSSSHYACGKCLSCIKYINIMYDLKLLKF